MIYTHNINPIIFSLGSVDLYWYGAMYAISFLLIDYMMKREVTKNRTYDSGACARKRKKSSFSIATTSY